MGLRFGCGLILGSLLKTKRALQNKSNRLGIFTQLNREHSTRLIEAMLTFARWSRR